MELLFENCINEIPIAAAEKKTEKKKILSSKITYDYNKLKFQDR
jgi:hypothetical protein